MNRMQNTSPRNAEAFMSVQLAELYDELAPAYERTRVPRLRPFVKKLLQWYDTRPGSHVLDAGCGTGLAATMVAPRAGHTGLVRGVDVSPRMLELAHHKAQSFGFDQCEFVLGDYARLDTPDATFDLLICSFALWGDPQSVLAEFLRLLKPGGVLLLQNWAPERDGAARTFQETLNAFSVADPHAPLAALREHLAQRAAAWGELSDPDRFTATLRAAGFATAGGQWFSNPLHFATFAELAEFYTTGVRAWAEYRSFTPERRDQFLDALHNAFRPLKTARGLDTEARAIQVVARKPNN